MKTSNKTNHRFIGIALLMMVLSLVTVNLSAQKSYNYNSLANLSNDFFTSMKNEILEAITEANAKYTDLGEERLEDWMINPEEWTVIEVPVAEIDFRENEMILEDWMMKANWENSSLIEEEMQLEDWMMDSNWDENSLIPEEQQLEDWMIQPNSRVSAK